MKHETFEEIKRIADLLAAALLADLKAGKLSKIGIEEVRQAIAAIDLHGFDKLTLDRLEEHTLRRLIERV